MSSKSKLKIALIQNSATNDAEANFNDTLAKIEQAAETGAKLVCLQELFRTPYFCQVHDPAIFDLAEPIPGPSTEKLGEVAARTGVAIVASLFERRTAGVYHNTAAIIGSDGSLAGIYRKMHIPHDPLYYEKYYFTPGDTGFRAFEVDGVKVGVCVCWDQWFPEAARLTALEGAQIIFYPTAIGWHPSEKAEFGAAQREAWMLAQRAHALANGVFVAAANRVGMERTPNSELEFWGSSFVADPFGRLIAEALTDKQEILTVECDLSLIEETRRNWPFLRDRRIDAYQGLLERFGAGKQT